MPPHLKVGFGKGHRDSHAIGFVCFASLARIGLLGRIFTCFDVQFRKYKHVYLSPKTSTLEAITMLHPNPRIVALFVREVDLLELPVGISCVHLEINAGFTWQSLAMRCIG